MTQQPKDTTEGLSTFADSGRIEVFAPKTAATRTRRLHMALSFAFDCVKKAASSNIPEKRFLLAHHAATTFVETALILKGYNLASQGDAATLIEAMPLILGEDFDDFTSYFTTCLQKMEKDKYGLYSLAPGVTREEADELLRRMHEFQRPMLVWLSNNGWWEITCGGEEDPPCLDIRLPED